MKIFLAVFATLTASLQCFSQPVQTPETNPADPAIEKFLLQSEQQRVAGDFKEASRFMNNAAMHVWEQRNYGDAIKYFNQSIQLNQTINNLSGIAKIHTNLGMIYSDLHEYEKSLHYFQQSLDYRLKHGEKIEIISTYINIAVVLNSLKQFDKAATNLEEALRLATEMSDANQMKSCYGMLAETYEKIGNQERTIHYFNLYRTFHEIVQRNKVIEANKETEATKLRLLETELENKEKELQLLARSNELEDTEEKLKNVSAEMRALLEGKSRQDLALTLLEKQVQLDEGKLRETEARADQQKAVIIVSVTGFVLLSLFLALLYRSNVYRKKTNLQLSEQNEEIRSLNENLEAQVQHRTSELRKTLSNLEKRNRDLDQFSQMISHNLRGPVANILGLGLIINKKNLADPLNLEVFDRLQNATHNLDSVVRDLSKILQVNDGLAIPTDKVNIIETIDITKNLLHDEIQKSGIEIVVKDNARHVVTITPYFESILYNLLSNAIKYSSSSSSPRATITTSINNGIFQMDITDNGSGINEKDIEKIFQPYKRLTTEGEGKGLGLYLVRTHVEALGGNIRVTSEIGKGSAFTIQLPQ